MNKENLIKFVELASNPNYGDCIYSTIQNKNGYGYNVVIKQCCHNLIEDLIKNGFTLGQSNKGMNVHFY